MQTINVFLISILFLFLAGCKTVNATQNYKSKNQTTQTAILKTELAALNLENPKVDMERNFAHGDKRFISICGIVCYCPGIEKNNYNFVKQFGSRIIQGTSDMTERGEYVELYNSAKKYAELYNQALLKKLKE
ncbi:hypothetical protein D4Q80_03255 [bacterium]|nr:MAG: hypothetical protein D4Q80_03255 [bacterium]